MRLQRSILTFISGGLGSVATLLVGMVATPFILGWLGKDQYGAVKVVLDWLGYLGLLELGLSDATLPVITQAVGSGEGTSVRRAFVASVRSYVRLLPLKLLGGALLVAAMPRLVALSPDIQVTDLRLACAIGVVANLLGLFSPLRVLLEAKQLGYYSNASVAVQALATTALSFICAWAGWGMAGQLLAFFIGSLLPLALTFAWAEGTYPGLWRELWRGAPDAQSWQAIWRLNRPMLLSHLCSRLSLMTDNIIIGYFFSTGGVAAFFLTQRLATIVQGQLYAIGNATWAGMEELRSQAGREAFEHRLVELSKLLVTAGLIFLGPICVFNQYFVTLWVGAAQYAGGLVTVAAACNAVLWGLIALWSWSFSTAGIANRLVKQYVASTVVNFTLSIVLTKLLGLPGPLLGTMAGLLTISMWAVPLGLKEHFGVRLLALAAGVARPVAVFALPLAAVYFAAQVWPPETWVALVAALAVAGLMLSGVAWVGVLNPQERQMWRARWQSLPVWRRRGRPGSSD